MSIGWNHKTIEELCLVTDYVANGSFKSLRENVQYNYDKDYAILLRTTDFTNNFKKSFVYVNEKSYKFLKKSSTFPDDIIICNVGSVGLTFLVPDLDQPMTLGPNSILIRPLKDDEIYSKFFYYLFTSPLGQGLIKTITSGTTQLKFNKTNFRKLSISFPSDVNEQKQIVEILDKVFEAIDKLKEIIERNIENSKELFQTKLNEIFSQKGEDWKEKKLGEVAEFRNGLNFSKSSKGETLKVVSVADFKDNFFVNTQNLSQVTIDGNLKDLDYLKLGDILAVRSNGNPNLIGRCMLVKNVKDKISFSGFTIRIRLLDKDIYPEFLNYFLKSSDR